MARAYPFLEKVYLKQMSITDDDLALISSSFCKFKELELVCCEGFGTNGLAIVASKCRQLKVLDLTETEVTNDEVDWISSFPDGETCLEYMIFDCVECPINFEALESLVDHSPSLKKLKVNKYISIRQLYHMLIKAPRLTHFGTGSFNFADNFQAPADQELDSLSAFAAYKSLVYLFGFRESVPAFKNICMI